MDTFNKIAKIISNQLGIDQSSVTMESTLDSLGSDSLDLVEIVMKIEDELGVEIDDSQIEQLKTVGQTVDYINSLIK